jgi:hypothetical protein
MKSSFLTPVILTFAAAAATVPAQTRDDLAISFPVQTPSGAGLPQLQSPSTPLRGSWLALHVNAPGHDFAVILLSGMLHAPGVKAPVGRDTLGIYADAMTLIATIPVPLRNGQGAVQVPLNIPIELIGLDLVSQAVTFPMSLGSVGATNAIVSNIGIVPFGGTAEIRSFAPQMWFGMAQAAAASYVFNVPKDGLLGLSGTRDKNCDLEVLVNGKGVLLIHQGTEDWSFDKLPVKAGDKVEVKPVQKDCKFKVTGKRYIGG